MTTLGVERARPTAVTLGLVLLSRLAACAPGGAEEGSQESGATRLMASSGLLRLHTYRNAASGDHVLTSDAAFRAPGYVYVGADGYALRPDQPQRPGTLALYTWFSEARQDYFTSTHPAWAATVVGTERAGYRFVRLEGYVFQRNVAGTSPLVAWWSPTREDHRTTSDPWWSRAAPSAAAGAYQIPAVVGHVLTGAPDVTWDGDVAFRRDPLDEGAARGERDLLVAMMEYRDAPFRHSAAEVDALFFGAVGRSVRELTRDSSNGAFMWRRAGVVRVAVPDDPDTTHDEGSWHAVWDEADTRLVLVSLNRCASGGACSGEYLSAQNGGGSRVATVSGQGANEVMGLVDGDGGRLLHGDTVRLKTLNGSFLGLSGEAMNASATLATAARFVVERVGGAGTVQHDTRFRLRVGSSWVSSTYTLGPLAGAQEFRMHKSVVDVERLFRNAVRGASRAGFDFSAFDRDRDGVVKRHELTLFALSSQPPRSGHLEGLTRSFAGTAVPGSAVRVFSMQVADTMENAALTTIAHELLHTLGARDLYGGSRGENTRLTLMGSTGSGADDDRSAFRLDPWHQLRLGWVSPRVVAFHSAGGNAVLRAPQDLVDADGETRPVLLYDPATYDRDGYRDYFLLEVRDSSLGGFDADAPARGLVVWQVRTDARGVPVTVPSQRYAGREMLAVSVFGAPAGERGNPTAWTEADGAFPLRYADGRATGMRLQVARETGATGRWVVSWSGDEGLTPRVDQWPSFARRGAEVTLSALLPAHNRECAVAFRNIASGVTATSAIESYTEGHRVRARVPSAFVAGSARLEIRCGALSSDPAPLSLE